VIFTGRKLKTLDSKEKEHKMNESIELKIAQLNILLTRELTGENKTKIKIVRSSLHRLLKEEIYYPSDMSDADWEYITQLMIRISKAMPFEDGFA
jgi:hypothetical protein